MAVNIGPRIGIEGESEYRKQINDIITQSKTLSSEMKALTSSFEGNAKTIKQNTEQHRILSEQIKVQEQRVEELSAMLDKSKAKYGENATQTQKWQQAVNNAQAELNNLNSQLKSLPTTLDLVGSKFSAVGDKIKSVSQKISSVGQTLTTAITLPVLGAGTAAVKLASDYEENLNKVDVAFKNNADEVKAWAKTATTQFGLSENAALEATSLFGDMGTSMGLTTSEASAMATSLTGLAGDLSSFKNVGIDQAMTALNGVFTGETESLKTLGIVMTETNLKEFAEECGLVYDEMGQAEKVTLRYNYVLSKTQNAQGDYARTSDGTANSMRTLQASIDNLGVAFGQHLLPIITPIINKVTDMVTQFGSLDDETKKLIITVAGIAAAVGPILMVAGSIGNAIGGISSGIGAILPVMGKIGPAIAKVGASALTAIPSIISFVAPFLPFIAVAGAVVAAGVLIYKNWDTIKAKAIELKDNIQGKWEEIKTSTTETWNSVKDNVSNSIDGIKSSAMEKWTSIKTTVASVGSAIKSVVKSDLSNIKAAYDDAGGGIKGIVAGAWEAIQSYFTLGFDVLNELTGGKLGEVKDKFFEILDDVSSYFSELPTKFYTWGTEMLSNLAKGIEDGISWVKEKISSVGDVISSYIHFSEPDKGSLKNFNSWMPDMMSQMAQGIENGRYLVQRAMADVSSDMALAPQAYASQSYVGTSNNLGSKLDSISALLGAGNNTNVNVTLQGDAAGVFRLVRTENNKFRKSTGYNPLG